MKIKVIGLTGPSGSGKTAMCACFSERGIPCIDADKLYHSMLVPPSECLDAIAEKFGTGVLCADGTLDRAALGKIVFSDGEKLKLLNSTVLDIVIARIREIIAEYSAEGVSAVAVDAPTLIESGFDRECDTVISVLADRELRIERISARDGISRELAEKRVFAQKSDEFYITHSDTVLYNNGTEEEFLKKARETLGAII